MAATLQVPARGGALRSAACVLAALLACLWVFAANGGALFYFDTGSYVERGQQIMAEIGLAPADQGGPMRADLGTAMPAFTESGPRTLDGTRSAVYSLVVGLFARMGALEGLVLLNAVVALVAVWLPVRVALRTLAPDLSPAVVTLGAVLLAALGSLPFYVAFLMADIMAPALILVAATLAAFAGVMRPWEVALALALGASAVVVHLSHLAIVALLVPLTVVVVLLAPGRRRWLAPLLMLALLGVGLAERVAFRAAAQATQNAEVVYRPFITARLIQDGPGLEYLDERCPDEAIPTCALHEALSWSDDPWRLTATHIAFATTPELGSFQLMSAQDRRDVAAGQVAFFVDVLRDRPVAVTLAFLGNTLRQVAMDSVDMTLQTDMIVERVQGLPGLALGGFRHGRLTRDTAWLGVVDPLQGALYAASGLFLVLALATRWVPSPVKVFIVMVGLGILVNAFVCGAISQPATRYGARVAWLLPTTAVIAGTFLFRRRAHDRRGLVAPGSGVAS